MRDTKDILDALVTACQAINLPEVGDPAAFDQVELWDSTDLVAALKRLTVSQARLALVIYTGEGWETDDSRGPRLLSVRRTVDVTLLISDRVIGGRPGAAYGDATHPGVMALKDLTIAAVTGRLIANPNGVDVRPLRADLVQVETEGLPGRSACTIDLACTGSWITETLGVGPVA